MNYTALHYCLHIRCIIKVIYNYLNNQNVLHYDFKTRLIFFVFSFLGQAFIKVKPYNKTAEEQTEVTFPCKGEAKPGNLTTSWFKYITVKKPKSRSYYSRNQNYPRFEKKPLRSINSLASRFQVKVDGSLVISEVAASDEGRYECQITNGIGKPISESAYLSVECK